MEYYKCNGYIMELGEKDFIDVDGYKMIFSPVLELTETVNLSIDEVGVFKFTDAKLIKVFEKLRKALISAQGIFGIEKLNYRFCTIEKFRQLHYDVDDDEGKDFGVEIVFKRPGEDTRVIQLAVKADDCVEEIIEYFKANAVDKESED